MPASLRMSGPASPFAVREEHRHMERFRGDNPVVVEGLVNRFGEQTVHEGLDLKVERGEILGVVGGSGTGKSVLMRSIIGVQNPARDHHPLTYSDRS